MFLFEVTNGYIGESYVRVYVWAADEASARALAETSYRTEDEQRLPYNRYGEKCWTDLKCQKLMSSDDMPFATVPSDSGWLANDEGGANAR